MESLGHGKRAHNGKTVNKGKKELRLFPFTTAVFLPEENHLTQTDSCLEQQRKIYKYVEER